MLDLIYVKYGVKVYYLIQAVEHYKIHEDDDVKQFDQATRQATMNLLEQ